MSRSARTSRPGGAAAELQPSEAFARDLDRDDPVRGYRRRFHIPRHDDGSPAIYLCGHSLGLQPRAVSSALDDELRAWAEHGIEAYFSGARSWYRYGLLFVPSLSRLVGAHPDEVVAMNGLTVNLHLLMSSFFHPGRGRYKILMEDPAFPSDVYAVKTQLRRCGLDPAEALIVARPRAGEDTLRGEDLAALLAAQGERIALILFGGINYLTGQLFDLGRLTAAARAAGCVVGLDLAHAVGNVPLQLHDWGVDFAAWCSYKYLNGGPGAVAGCFIHRRHASDTSLPRLGGWWGNDPATRFRMEPEFEPVAGAEGWQLSTPPILAMAPLRVALEIFDEVGLPALRAKSELLTAYLVFLVDRIRGDRCRVITPRSPAERGAQISLRVRGDAERLQRALAARGVIVDFRQPDILRVAPAPLYNSFHEVWRFAGILERELQSLS